MKIKCPSCSTQLNIPDAAAGKVVKCPCGKQLRAPGGAPQAASPAGSGARPAGAMPARPMARQTHRGANTIDADMFDELTEDDLVPVRSASNPFGASAGGKLRQQYGPSGSGGGGNVAYGGASMSIASIGSRVGGAIIDGVMVMIGLAVGMGLSVAVMAAMGPPAENDNPLVSASFWLILLGGGIPSIINYVLISKSGQTVGKKMVGTVIVDQETGVPVGFAQGALQRTIVFGMFTGIPVIGAVLALADIGFLFSEDHRTLHDRFAKTKVVNKR